MIGLLIGVLSVAACAGDKAQKKDAFFEKWKTLEQTSAGSSPVAVPRMIDISDQVSQGGTGPVDEKPIVSVRLLPTAEVNLKMRQADVKSVLRSLALAVNLNILIKNDIKGEVSVDFKAVPWDQAFNSILRTYGLTYIWEGDRIIRVLSLDDLERDLKQKTQEMGSRWVEPLKTVVVNISYADAKDLRENFQEFLTKDKEGKSRGSIKVDVHSNSLIISAIQDDIDRMMPIIEKVDKPTSQIQIKANIVEASKSTARDLGIQWGGVYGRKVGDQGLYVTPGGTGGSTVSPGSALEGGYTPAYGSPGVGGQGFGVNFPASGLTSTASATLGLLFGTIGGNLLEAQLSALQEDGKINILSSPSITTMDNQTAYTENGERVPYVTTETSGGTTSRTVKFEDVVLRLEITPHVIDGKNLKMKVVVKKDEVDTSRDVEGNPFIIKKKTETNLIVMNGETIVISGLTKMRTTDSESGVPWLKTVPGLGWLFKASGKTESMEEVLIFITPTILPPQPAAVSKPLADKSVEKEQ
ncbi:MAG: type IV pilus secretin PilQ [Deltaproteobacteria bacterium]|nr:type IV pilus secretin PilQ [Deltaproteobacteria bacterium]